MGGGAHGKSCGPCHLCCRVFPIPEAGKLHTDWCPHLDIGKGCLIHGTRPQTCQDFHCLWLYNENLPDEWRPDIAGFVLSDPEPWAFLVTNDPHHPRAWRREPYQAQIRTWAEAAGNRGSFAGVREAETLLLLVRGDDKIIEGA